MIDFKSRVKKNIDCKKHPRVVGILKESLKTTIIIKQILDLRVKLIVGKLLALAFAVEKRQTKAILEDKTI